jgi:hypothetical protein
MARRPTSVKPLPLVAAWRNAIRDSDLHRTDKLIAYTISTYMNAAGVGFPSKQTIARGASLASTRAVDQSVKRIESAGYLGVDRTLGGRSSNTYRALIPPHAHAGVPGHDHAGGGASRFADPRTSVRAPLHDGAPESGFEIESESGKVMNDLNIKCNGCNGIRDFDGYCKTCNDTLFIPRAGGGESNDGVGR